MFTRLLTLKPTGKNCFEAPQAPENGKRMFGGQFLAQSLLAAAATVDHDRDVNSLHAYFLRPGDVDLPVQLQVESVRDGRSFSSRQVVAKQESKELFRMLVSFQVPVVTPHYEGCRMPDVPPPEEVTTSYGDFTLQQTGETDWDGLARPMDIRYINPPGARGQAITESQLMWMKIRGTLTDEPGVHRAGLVYLSDSTLVDHVMLPHGLRWQDDDFEGTSLDHAMWFHRTTRADEWLLFVQNVEATGHGRGLVSGRLFDRSGMLVANCVQEGLMRWVAS